MYCASRPLGESGELDILYTLLQKNETDVKMKNWRQRRKQKEIMGLNHMWKYIEGPRVK